MVNQKEYKIFATIPTLLYDPLASRVPKSLPVGRPDFLCSNQLWGFNFCPPFHPDVPPHGRTGRSRPMPVDGRGKKSMDNCGWCRNKEFLDAKQQQGNCKIIRNCYGRAWEDHCRSRASFQSFKLRAPCKPWTLFSFVQRHIDFWKYPPVEAVVNEVVDALVHLTRLLQRLVVGVRIQLRGATKKKIESFQKWIVRRGPLMLTCCWKKNLLLIIDLATRKEWAT